MRSIAIWWQAIRPKTLGLAGSPVLLGSTVAVGEGHDLRGMPAVAALLAAMLIQIGTNLHNDAADHLRGVDTADRVGPLRVTQAGLLSAQQVMHGAWVSFMLAFLLGIYLVAQGGPLILALGVASLLAGAAYSGGPYPISHSPLGELFVLLFFGLIAVLGSYWLQTEALSARAWLAGIVAGAPAAAVLVVNNARDRASDAGAGRRTLAVLYGEGFCRVEFATLLGVPFGLLAWSGLGGVLPYVALPWALRLGWAFARTRQPAAYNPLLPETARFQVFLVLLVAIGERL